MDKLTFQALGRELSAHPTAIYRHFRNKDELLLALIDALHEEALSHTPPPTDDWADDLMRIAVHTHDAFLRHPNVGALAAARTARRENEFRSVERKLDTACAGPVSTTPDAARYYRVFADLVLAYSAMDASLAALAPGTRDADLHAWEDGLPGACPPRQVPPTSPGRASVPRGSRPPGTLRHGRPVGIEQVRTTARNGDRSGEGRDGHRARRSPPRARRSGSSAVVVSRGGAPSRRRARPPGPDGTGPPLLRHVEQQTGPPASAPPARTPPAVPSPPASAGPP